MSSAPSPAHRSSSTAAFMRPARPATSSAPTPPPARRSLPKSSVPTKSTPHPPMLTVASTFPCTRRASLSSRSRATSPSSSQTTRWSPARPASVRPRSTATRFSILPRTACTASVRNRPRRLSQPRFPHPRPQPSPPLRSPPCKWCRRNSPSAPASPRRLRSGASMLPAAA